MLKKLGRRQPSPYFAISSGRAAALAQQSPQRDALANRPAFPVPLSVRLLDKLRGR